MNYEMDFKELLENKTLLAPIKIKGIIILH